MFTTNNRKSNIFSFLAGAFSVFAIVLLTGTATLDPVGKYEMEVAINGKITQIYVLDTTTGQVKWVDSMNTPFTQMKGD